MVVYVTEQGATITRRRGLLRVSKGGALLQQVHIADLQQLVLFGQVQLSTQALHALLARGVDTALLTLTGRFLGRLSSGLGKNIELRRAQFERLGRPEEALALCRRYVQGKLQNCLTLLRRHNRVQRSDRLARDAASIRHCLAELEGAGSVERVRGLEGAGTARYFSALRGVFRAPGMAFFRRARRPPPDPVNILLSIGYTLLGNLLHSMCETAGLDPFLGALHASHYGRPSLALDLIEEWRPVIVDTAAIRAVNTRSIVAADFHRVSAEETAAEEVLWREQEEARAEAAERSAGGGATEGEEDEGSAQGPMNPPRQVLISSAGLKKWILALERRFEETCFYESTATTLSYRQILRKQVYLLARHLRGEQPYVPFLSRG